ncbi:MAG: peptide deformylase [Thermodesulfobacteriota bacterium]
MAKRTILSFPNPVLRQQAKPVARFGPELKQLVADMAETMYAAPGIGLAAPQIGVSEQIVVVDINPPEDRNLIVLVNPCIVHREGEAVDTEGCLSVIEYTAEVKRARRIVVQARDIEGKPLEFDAEEWYARVLQHEIDHLNGILYIDYLSSLKRTLYKKKLRKILQEREREGGEP